MLHHAFSQVELEVLETIRRLADLDHPPILLASQSETNKQLATFVIREGDTLSTGRLTRGAFERARDFASELGHAVNAAAPRGVCWTVSIVFARRDLARPPYLDVFWAIVPDPHWVWTE